MKKKSSKKPVYSKNGEQYHIKLKKGDIGEYVLLCGDPDRCSVIAKYFDKSKFVAKAREFTTYTGYIGKTKVSVCSTGIGGPSAAIALEELVAVGGKYFIRIGTSGGMDLDVKPGDVVIATGAIRMEGTSKEYAPIEWPAVADFDIICALKKAAEAKHKRYHIGVVECKDSFYGQHSPENSPVSYELISKWDAWCKLGCKASEMESAALFVVANALNVKVGTILLAVANQERAKKGLENKFNGDIDAPIEIAIEAIKNLVK